MMASCPTRGYYDSLYLDCKLAGCNRRYSVLFSRFPIIGSLLFINDEFFNGMFYTNSKNSRRYVWVSQQILFLF